MSREDFEGIREHAKQQHAERVAKNPERLDYAVEQLKNNGFNFKVCNESTGQVNCYFENGEVLTFYAGTGKIKGYEHARGIHNFIALCFKKRRSIKGEVADEQAVYADEGAACWMSDKEAHKDRKLFVHNLGVLLSQTRERILSAELDDNEIVTVTFKGGATKRINVNMDSYMAIVRDVTKYIE